YLPSTLRGRSGPGNPDRVSILVLLDICPQLLIERRLNDPHTATSFNPCSAGYLPSTATGDLLWYDVNKFQSLFCWISALNTGGGVAVAGGVRAVSILVLLDICPQPVSTRADQWSSRRFNPCS